MSPPSPLIFVFLVQFYLMNKLFRLPLRLVQQLTSHLNVLLSMFLLQDYFHFVMFNFEQQ
jgi:hypothetical protein